jgi:hypothetical protein
MHTCLPTTEEWHNVLYDHANQVTWADIWAQNKNHTLEMVMLEFECMYNFHVLPDQPLGFIQATENLPQWVTGTERVTDVLKYMLLCFDKVHNSWR